MLTDCHCPYGKVPFYYISKSITKILGILKASYMETFLLLIMCSLHKVNSIKIFHDIVLASGKTVSYIVGGCPPIKTLALNFF